MTSRPLIPQTDPRANYIAHREEIDAAISRVLSSGSYILGNEVEAFEEEFAAYIGVRHAVGVASGTDAIEIGLRACGVGRGDAVLTVSFTAVATVSAIERIGATPVFVDIDPETLTMDTGRLEEKIKESIPFASAIVPVHLYGRPAAMAEIVEIARKYGLAVVEDCAQAHGAAIMGRRVGCWGEIGAFSFYPTKNLGALGDGGMVVTNGPALADRSRLFRQYGWRRRYISESAGVNSRLDEVQAAILRVKLRYLDEENGRRASIAEHYSIALGETTISLPAPNRSVVHAYHQYVVRTSERDPLQAYLADQGIQTLIHYPQPVHLQPAYERLRRNHRELEQSERRAAEVLSLPMFPELSQDQVDTVTECIRAWLELRHDEPRESRLGTRIPN